MYTTIPAVSVGCACLATHYYLKARRTTTPFPPGPQGHWLVGNLMDIPSQFAWLKFSDWKEQYGNVVYAHIPGQSFVVLNSLEAVTDLLDGRSANYSDRPNLTMIGELVGVENFMFSMPYGDVWRQRRRLTHTALNTEIVKRYEEMQARHMKDLIESLIDCPQDFMEAIHLAVGRITVSVAYGLPIESTDRHIKAAKEAMEMVARGIVPGTLNFFVDTLPFLKHMPTWIPGSPRQFAAVGKAQLEKMLGPPIAEQISLTASGLFVPSYISDLVQKLENDPKKMTPPEMNHILKWSAGDIFSAGVETVWATMMCFILAMARNPAVQRRAQTELDLAVPDGRLPILSDFVDLPYTAAIVKETLRWKPVVPLAFPRQTREANTYKGMHIPKNATILPNVWQISRTECGAYPPEDFVPDRFLESVPATDPFNYVFGFGKRSCPGKKLGLNNVQLFVSYLLYSFDILPILDSSGQPKFPDPEFVSGLISYPKPFEVTFRPRSKQVLDMLRD